MIRLEGISKIFETDTVLNNISWEIKKGEKIGLVGSNGAGKTTQFKILIGEEDQTSGSIIKEGNPKIAYLRQEFDCSLKKTVREELESAFEEIQEVSEKLDSLEKEMKLLESTKDMQKIEILVHELAIFQEKFEILGGYKVQSEIDKLLPKLGFSLLEGDELVKNFSGG